jgi:hypothetical protein
MPDSTGAPSRGPNGRSAINVGVLVGETSTDSVAGVPLRVAGPFARLVSDLVVASGVATCGLLVSSDLGSLVLLWIWESLVG